MKKEIKKEFEVQGRFGWRYRKKNRREFLTLLLLYKCYECGVEKNGKNIFSYVDGNNIAITKNSPNLCKSCYTKKY